MNAKDGATGFNFYPSLVQTFLAFFFFFSFLERICVLCTSKSWEHVSVHISEGLAVNRWCHPAGGVLHGVRGKRPQWCPRAVPDWCRPYSSLALPCFRHYQRLLNRDSVFFLESHTCSSQTLPTELCPRPSWCSLTSQGSVKNPHLLSCNWPPPALPFSLSAFYIVSCCSASHTLKTVFSVATLHCFHLLLASTLQEESSYMCTAPPDPRNRT